MTDTSLLLTLHISTYNTYIVLDIYFLSFNVLIFNFLMLSFLIFFTLPWLDQTLDFQGRYT